MRLPASHGSTTRWPNYGDAARRRVVLASYLLADGLFQDRLRNSGADLVADPLGGHPAMVRLIANRFKRARVPLPA